VTKPKFLRLERRIEFNCGHSATTRVTWFDDTPAAIEERWQKLTAEYECELCRQNRLWFDVWKELTAEGLEHLAHTADLYDIVRTRSKIGATQ